MYRNQASQKVAVFAWDKTADAPKTGDAANITAAVSLDGGAPAALADANPAELGAGTMAGVYVFDLAQGETDGALVVIAATSTTSGVQLEPVAVYTRTP